MYYFWVFTLDIFLLVWCVPDNQTLHLFLILYNDNDWRISKSITKEYFEWEIEKASLKQIINSKFTLRYTLSFHFAFQELKIETWYFDCWRLDYNDDSAVFSVSQRRSASKYSIFTCNIFNILAHYNMYIKVATLLFRNWNSTQ